MGGGTTRLCKRGGRLSFAGPASRPVLPENVRRDVGPSRRGWTPPYRGNSWRYLSRPTERSHPIRNCFRCPHHRSSSRKVLEFPSAAASQWITLPSLHAGTRSKASSSLFSPVDEAIGARKTLCQTTPPARLFGLSPLSEATGDSCPRRSPLRQHLLRSHLDSFHRLGPRAGWPWCLRPRATDRRQRPHSPHLSPADHDF